VVIRIKTEYSLNPVMPRGRKKNQKRGERAEYSLKPEWHPKILSHNPAPLADRTDVTNRIQLLRNRGYVYLNELPESSAVDLQYGPGGVAAGHFRSADRCGVPSV
jgi:hypothetical protein